MMRSISACLAVLCASCGDESAPPPLAAHVLRLRETSKCLLGGRPMRLAFMVTNMSGEPKEVPVPEDFLAGLEIAAPDGTIVRKAAESRVKERVRVEARGSFEREVDVSGVVDAGEGKEGRYTFTWHFEGAKSNALRTYVIPDYAAEIETSLGVLKFEFFPEAAPGHVENFAKLARRGFYDGLVFHRLIRNFMVQGGCPRGDGSGGPGYSIAAEFNDRPHQFGTLSMARTQDPDSAGSQFFICFMELPEFDGRYTAFGRLTAGEDVLRKIEEVPTDHNPCAGCGAELPPQPTGHCGKQGHHQDRPREDVKILKATVKLREKTP